MDQGYMHAANYQCPCYIAVACMNLTSRGNFLMPHARVNTHTLQTGLDGTCGQLAGRMQCHSMGRVSPCMTKRNHAILPILFIRLVTSHLNLTVLEIIFDHASKYSKKLTMSQVAGRTLCHSMGPIADYNFTLSLHQIKKSHVHAGGGNTRMRR